MRVFEGGFVLVDRIEDTARQRATEVVRTKAGRYSVGFLVYDPVTKSVILVGQQRTAMISDDNPTGMIIEVPAGRCDKPESVKATIAREAGEEIGATIEEDQIELINKGRAVALSPGILDEMMYLAIVELRPGQLSEDRVFGVAEEGEVIIRKQLSLVEALSLPCNDLKTLTLLAELDRRHMFKDIFESSSS